MPLSSPALRRFVRHALVAASGVPTPDRKQLALAFDLLCDRLRRRLNPMFGRAPIEALFARALHLSAAEFSWLNEVVSNTGEPCSLETLVRITPPLEPHVVEDGLAAVLANDIALLRTFIGDDLVMPLVQDAWGTASLGDASGEAEGDHE